MSHDLANQPHLLGRPLIYIVDEAAWAEGIVYATWVDMGQCLESIRGAINRFLAKSPIPGGGFLIKDDRGFYSLEIGSEEDLESIQEKAWLIAEHGLLGVKLLQHYRGDIQATQKALRCGYQGRYDDELEYAIEFFGSQHLNQVPEEIRGYIDYYKFRQNLFSSSHFSIVVEGRCHVFRRL